MVLVWLRFGFGKVAVGAMDGISTCIAFPVKAFTNGFPLSLRTVIDDALQTIAISERPSPIFVTPSGISMLVRLLQSSNAVTGIPKKVCKCR